MALADVFQVVKTEVAWLVVVAATIIGKVAWLVHLDVTLVFQASLVEQAQTFQAFACAVLFTVQLAFDATLHLSLMPISIQGPLVIVIGQISVFVTIIKVVVVVTKDLTSIIVDIDVTSMVTIKTIVAIESIEALGIATFAAIPEDVTCTATMVSIAESDLIFRMESMVELDIIADIVVEWFMDCMAATDCHQYHSSFVHRKTQA